MNGANVRSAQIELRRSHQGHAQRAEGVAERGPLRNGSHPHITQRNADDGAQNQRDGDPLVVHDAVVQQRACNGQHHADFARPNPVPRRSRRTQPLERKDEEQRQR